MRWDFRFVGRRVRVSRAQPAKPAGGGGSALSTSRECLFATLFSYLSPPFRSPHVKQPFAFAALQGGAKVPFHDGRGGGVDAATLHFPVCIPGQARETNHSGLPRVGASEGCLNDEAVPRSPVRSSPSLLAFLPSLQVAECTN